MEIKISKHKVTKDLMRTRQVKCLALDRCLEPKYSVCEAVVGMIATKIYSRYML